MENKLYVGNLNYNIDEKTLLHLLSYAGRVLAVKIVRDPFDQSSKGFAFVEMATTQAAEKAISLLNKRPFQGRELKVASAHSNDSVLGPKEYKRTNKEAAHFTSTLKSK